LGIDLQAPPLYQWNDEWRVKAKSELLYPESDAAKWIFPQEKATFETLYQGTFILILL